MQKKKILLCLEATEGGALKHIIYLATKLDREKFDITVCLSTLRSPQIFPAIATLKNLGIAVVEIQMVRNISPVPDLLAFLKIFFLLGRERFGIVHAHSSKAGALFRVAAWCFNTPMIVYTPHCFYFQGKKGLKRNLFILLEKVLARTTHAIIVSKNEEKEAIAAGLCDRRKLYNINNAIDVAEYGHVPGKEEIRTRYGIPVDAIVIGMVGRLEKQKNPALFVHLAKEIHNRHNNTFFILSGHGRLKDDIHRLIRSYRMEDRIMLTGHIEEIRQIYSVLDIYLSTSLWEGQPYSILEAAHFGIPIFTSYDSSFACPIPGNPPRTSHEIQASSEIRSSREIVESLCRLIEKKEFIPAMGHAAKELIKSEYSFPQFLEKHENLYQSQPSVKGL